MVDTTFGAPLTGTETVYLDPSSARSLQLMQQKIPSSASTCADGG